MNFLNENRYFERRDDGFVYRPTIFSAGFAVTSAEKQRLFEAIRRIEGRFLLEGLGLILLIGSLFWTGLVTSPTPIPWFIVLSVGAVLLLAPTVVWRRRRRVEAVLGRREPDVPRLPLREALMRPRPVLARRHAIPVLRSVIGLFVAVTVVIDLVSLTPVVAGLLPRHYLEGGPDSEAIAVALSQTLYSPVYWLVVAAINVLMLGCARLLFLEVRRLRSHPDMNEPNGSGSASR